MRHLILSLALLLPLSAWAQQKNTEKMQVEIWSDVVCPFCYIGKRHFEAALATFEKAADIQIVWRSYQLDPDLHPTQKMNSYEYLAQRYGISYKESVARHESVVASAKAVGLHYQFDKAIVANTLLAHCLIQKAKELDQASNLKEQLMQAYFIDGKDLNDQKILIDIAQKAGMSEADAKDALANPKYKTLVQNDIARGEAFGVQGVPFFVFNEKYTVYGAQPAKVFSQTLQKALEDWRKEKKK